MSKKPSIWDKLFHETMETIEDTLYSTVEDIMDDLEESLNNAINRAETNARRRMMFMSDEEPGPQEPRQKRSRASSTTPQEQPKSHYHTLGVHIGASHEEISTKYKTLAKRYHPDRNRSKVAEEKMKVINAAWEVLKDPVKRKEYDRVIGVG